MLGPAIHVLYRRESSAEKKGELLRLLRLLEKKLDKDEQSSKHVRMGPTDISIV